MRFYEFATPSLNRTAHVNVLLPDGYHNSGKRYPVLYLLHGGTQDFRKFDLEDDIRGLTAGREMIVVMPDGGPAGWYTNPAATGFSGLRNWENFHMRELIPWIDANFRTWGEFAGRAVSGFSMGGFGALKYTHVWYGHFASVSSHSGPADLRRDLGLVTHWANATSATVELLGGSAYGVPFWNEGLVSRDNPMEHIERFRGKRIFLVAGRSPEPLNVFDRINENQVLAGQRGFRAALDRAGIRHIPHEPEGGHFVRRNLLQEDIDGIVRHLRRAG